MDFKDFIKSFEVGMYTEAAERGKCLTSYLEDVADEKDAESNEGIYKDLSLHEIALLKRKMISQGLTPPLTAFEKALDHFGIIITGSHSSTIEKVFAETASAILFPEIISNRIYWARLATAVYENFIASRQSIDGIKYRNLYLTETANKLDLAEVGEDVDLPETDVKLSKEDIILKKYGRIFTFSYEVLKYSSIASLDSLVLARIGRQFGVSVTERMIYVLLNGDGAASGLKSANTTQYTTDGEVDPLDIITFMTCLPIGYQLDQFVGPVAYMRKYWHTLSQMTNPAAQKAQVPIPFPTGYRWGTDVLTSDYFLGVDSSCALEFITVDNILMTEVDKIITKQRVRSVVSSLSNFKILDRDGIGGHNNAS